MLFIILRIHKSNTNMDRTTKVIHGLTIEKAMFYIRQGWHVRWTCPNFTHGTDFVKFTDIKVITPHMLYTNTWDVIENKSSLKE